MGAQELEEAEEAIRLAKERFSGLTDFGFGVYLDKGMTLAEIKLKFARERSAFCPKQVATAIAFLRQCEPTKTLNTNSYSLKHKAERWGKRLGLESYLTNGALIVAAVYLGFSVRQHDGPNASVGVSKQSITALEAA